MALEHIHVNQSSQTITFTDRTPDDFTATICLSFAEVRQLAAEIRGNGDRFTAEDRTRAGNTPTCGFCDGQHGEEDCPESDNALVVASAVELAVDHAVAQWEGEGGRHA